MTFKMILFIADSPSFYYVCQKYTRMIIYGTNHLRRKPILTKETCPECGKMDSITVIPEFEYVHFFAIPTIPYKKRFLVYCPDCQETFNPDSFAFSHESKHLLKKPLWLYSGLIIAVLVISGIIVGHKITQHNDYKHSVEYINAPREGDIYEVRSVDNEFTVMKVIAVDNDSIYCRYSSYMSDRESGIEDLYKEPYKNQFEEDIFSYTKEDLLSALNDKIVLRITRN